MHCCRGASTSLGQWSCNASRSRASRFWANLSSIFGEDYGRIIELMCGSREPSRIWGVDPWDRAMDLWESDGCSAISRYLTTCQRTFRLAARQSGLIYAFSVCTHLSERATRPALATLRSSVNDNGLCVIAIQPWEYWDMASAGGNPVDCNLMKQQHDGRGFAFTPLNLPAH